MSSRKPKTINPDEVDPSVYYYDEVYDEMKDQEDSRVADSKARSKEKNKESKYIQGMIQMAEQRQVDKEIRKFKRYTRDRDAVGSKDDNEDIYITKSYRKKLDEMEALERDRQRQSEREKERALNFVKGSSSKIRSSKEKRSEKRSNSNEKHSTKEDRNKVNEQRSKEVPDARGSGPETNQLVTFEDRKAYLRKVLAKRTVGEVFDEAVKRYMLRKASSQKNA